MKLLNLLMSLMILSASTASYAKEIQINPTSKLELCDLIIDKCEAALNQKDVTIDLLETEVDLLKKRKPKSNWLLWLLGGVVTGLVIGNAQN